MSTKVHVEVGFEQLVFEGGDLDGDRFGTVYGF